MQSSEIYRIVSAKTVLQPGDESDVIRFIVKKLRVTIFTFTF